MSTTAKTRVFVVNDQKPMCMLWQRMINIQDDMECVGAAYDGNSAVSEGGPLKPDVVVMDVMMPGIDGYEAAEKIKAVSPRTRIIICSARSDIHDRSREIGASAALVLPVAPEALIRVIRKVVEISPHMAHSVEEPTLEATDVQPDDTPMPQ
ncbi:MAG: response regulator [Anaerolineae bacterium]|nr:response regulator [Anaerolineae bacterium]MCA9896199.1 response regulator [Anaerolineae bacterium]